MTNLFIIILTKANIGTPLRLHAFKDMQEVDAAIAWQVKCGHPRASYAIVTPDKDSLGVMLTEEREPIFVYNEGWKEDAYARFILDNWESK
jgi:hypothetical protein